MTELKAAVVLVIALLYLLLLEGMTHAVAHRFPASPARPLA